MRLLVFLVVIAIGASSFPSESCPTSIAQTRLGTFRGIVVDIKGDRVRGASVKVEGTDFTRDVEPNRKGYFEIDLPAGVYEVTVNKSGFATYRLTHLEVKGGDEQSHIFRLEASRVQ